MIFFKIFLRIAQITGFSVLLAGCVATGQGIGSGPSTSFVTTPSVDKPPSAKKAQEAIEVLDLTYLQAIEVSQKVGAEVFKDSVIEVRPDFGLVGIFNRSFWMGDVRVIVEPKLVRNLNSPKEFGIIFDVKSEGVGRNMSLLPGYGVSNFLDGLANHRISKGIPTKRFTNYEILRDKGVVETVAASIPTSYAGFQSFIEQGGGRAPYEGIWSEAAGKYTLGVIRTPEDREFPVKAFILESKVPNWLPGEIKIKFRRPPDRGAVTASYYLESKVEIGTTWRVTEGLIEAVAAPIERFQIAFVQQHSGSTPIAAGRPVRGSGTAWAVADGTFVTNQHVIEGARRILVGFKESSPVEARLLIADKRLDLAVLQLPTGQGKYPPIPFSRNLAENGTKVFAIGFPLASKLGDQPRITDGLINAQDGYQQDVTRYQISAAVNPGNSGGPLLDEKGNVLGVVVEKLTGADGINFAIKSNYLASLLEQVGVSPLAPLSQTLSPVEIASKYRNSVLPVWVE
jgi:S1-C subfamily serine protease